MRLLCATLGFLFGLVSFSVEVQAKDSLVPENIRVRLFKEQKTVRIYGQGLRVQSFQNPYRPVAIPTGGFVDVELLHKGTQRAWAVTLNGQGSARILTQEYLLLQGSSMRINAKSLPDKLLLSSSKRGIDVVGVLPLEDYVVGVISSEMPLTWPLETLKAQAVAARSYAKAVMLERAQKPFHVESSVMDQVFRHVASSHNKDALVNKAVGAVRATEGIYLYSKNNQVLKAFFHSDCGGRTTLAKNVWSGGVESGVAVDSSCPTSPKSQWRLTLSRAELSRRLKLAPFNSLSLIKAPTEERIKEVRLVYNGKPGVILSANEFRQRLGFTELKSSLFHVHIEGDNFHFQGQGFGHGVGLCQWGSRVLGQQGQDFKQILRHYYPLAQFK